MIKSSPVSAIFSASMLVFATSFAMPTYADDDKKAEEEELARQKPGEMINSGAVLWRIEKEGSIKNYLFGTFHIPDRAIVKLPPKVRKALEGSSTAAFEINNGSQKPGFAFTSEMWLKDGRSLKEILDPELYEQVVAMGKEYKMTERSIFPLKPWAASWIGGGTKEQRALIRAGRPVLDDYIEQEALRIGMKIEPLEFEPERLIGWDFLPEEDQIKLIKQRLATYKDDEEDMKKSIAMYLNRDIHGIVTKSKEDFAVMSKESAEMIWDFFLVKRNRRMVDEAIPLMMKGGGVFIAVGTAHLPGKGGMVEMFEEEGFTVTPVY